MNRYFFTSITLLFSIFCFSQNIDNERITIKQWHLPTVIIPNEIETYNIVFNDSSSELLIHIESKEGNQKQPFSFNNSIKKSNISEILNLRTFKLVDKNPNLIIKLVSGKKDIFIKTEKANEILSSKEKPSYIGKVFFTTNIAVTVSDVNGKTYHQFNKDLNVNLGEASVVNNFSIKDRNIALSEAVNLFNKNHTNYNDVIYNAYNSAVQDIAKKIKEDIDYYIEDQGINFFTIKKPEKYSAEKINEIAAKINDIANKDYSDDYFDNLNKEAKASLEILANELPKYDVNDKSEKKISWAIYTNLSGIYYILKDFDKTIELINKRQEISYKKDYTYNADIAKSRKALLAKHYDEKGAPIKDFESINYLNKNNATNNEEKVDEAEAVIKEEGYVNGLLTNIKGETISGSFKVNQSSSNSGIVDLNFSDATYVIMKYTNDKGKIKTKKYKAEDIESLKFGNITFHSVDFKSSSITGGAVDLGKMLLSGSKNRLVKVLLNTPKIKVYEYNGEIVLKKENDKKGQSTNTAGFAVSFKKKLAKYFKDCPEIEEKILSGSVKNNKTDLLNISEEYSKCK